MLSPAYLMGVADPVIEIYSQVENDIISDIARRIVKTGTITETAAFQLEKAKQFGMLNDDVVKILSKATNKSEKEIKKLIQQAGIKSLAFDDAIYRAAGLDPAAFAQSPALQAVLLQGTDSTLGLIGNFTKTTADMAQEAFGQSLDRAYLQLMSGAYDPNTAIKQAIRELSTKGMSLVAYPTGAVATLETAVRRAVLTGLNQSVAKLQLARLDEMGGELVEVTSHAGARPSHAAWQGEVYYVKGKHRKYKEFYSTTGYGNGDGLCGWNCYHSFYPYFEGLSTRSFEHDPSQEAGRNNNRDYELQQKQRYYERQIRSAKRECVAYDSARQATSNSELKEELNIDFQKASVKLKGREESLKKFVSQNNLTRYNEREWTAGFDRSVSSKAVWANKKAVKG